jgi:PAS domain S-box-containing protein
MALSSILPSGMINIDLVIHAFNSIPDEILLLDEKMNVQYANASFLRNNQLYLEAIVGKPCGGIGRRICGEGCFKGAEYCPFHTALTEKRHEVQVRKQVEPDGREHSYTVVGAPLLDDDHNLIGLLGMVRDVTQHMALEEELHATEVQLRQFMEMAPIGTYVKNPEGRYLEVNPAACNLFGKPANDILGRTNDEIFPQDTAQVMSEGDDKVLNLGREVTIANQIIFEGNPAYLSTIKYPILGSNGEVSAMCGLSMDVTKQKKAEAELIRTREYLENILDNSSVIIITADLLGNVVSFNREAASTLQYKAEEVIGKPIHMFFVESEERKIITEAVERQGQIRNWDTVMTRRDRTTLDVLVNWSILNDSAGRTIGTVAIARDISHRKALLEQVAHSERQAAVGRLAAGVAHEINNPLAMIGEIAGYLNDLLSVDSAAVGVDLIAELKDGLPKIINHVKMGSSITARLLSFARKGEVKVEVADVNAALMSSLPFVARNAKLARVTIHEAYAENLPPVGVEELQLQEIFINIINNAVQALEVKKDGNIWVKTDAEKHKVRVVIQDDGPGIAEEVQKRLFSPFVTTKPVGKGTGLGLSICYGIVKRYGGEIRVDSSPGSGARFEIIFPAVESTISAKAQPSSR